MSIWLSYQKNFPQVQKELVHFHIFSCSELNVTFLVIRIKVKIIKKIIFPYSFDLILQGTGKKQNESKREIFLFIII